MEKNTENNLLEIPLLDIEFFTTEDDSMLTQEEYELLSYVDVLSYVFKNKNYALLIRGEYDVFIKALVYFLIDHRPERDKNIESLLKLINAAVAEDDEKSAIDVIFSKIELCKPADPGAAYYLLHKKRPFEEQQRVINLWKESVSKYLTVTQKTN